MLNSSVRPSPLLWRTWWLRPTRPTCSRLPGSLWRPEARQRGRRPASRKVWILPISGGSKRSQKAFAISAGSHHSAELGQTKSLFQPSLGVSPRMHAILGPFSPTASSAPTGCASLGRPTGTLSLFLVPTWLWHSQSPTCSYMGVPDVSRESEEEIAALETMGGPRGPAP